MQIIVLVWVIVILFGVLLGLLIVREVRTRRGELAAPPIRPSATFEEQRYRRATWLIIGLWFLFCLATLNHNGPFFDEGIYVTAGQRTFEGHGTTDGYLTWFAGSLLWPMLAAVGYHAAGLIGTRIVALILATMAFVAVVQATKNLFGQKASFWTALAYAVSGPTVALARLGVYDVPALAGIAISFWAVTELERRDHRIWLGVAALTFTMSMFAKYPIGLMLLPIGGIIFVLRKGKTITDIGIFGLVSLAITLAFYLPAREQLGILIHWQLANKPTFGSTPAMIGFALLTLSVAPFPLALIGWFMAKDKRILASVLLLSLTIWPAYHLLSRNPVGDSKHIVFGYLFAYPLIGLALVTMWERWRRKAVAVVVILALAVWGFIQLDRLDRAWPDVRQAASYLTGQVQPGQKLLINESWPYIMYLYTEGRIHSPWDVFDVYRITHGESEIGLCEYDWFVDVQGSYEWPESILETVQQCGDFEPVFSTSSTVVGLGTDLDFTAYPVQTTIWQNTSRK